MLIIPNAPQLCTGLWERRVLDGYAFIYSVACATGGQHRVAYSAARGARTLGLGARGSLERCVSFLFH